MRNEGYDNNDKYDNACQNLDVQSYLMENEIMKINNNYYFSTTYSYVSIKFHIYKLTLAD